jgi:hypothetical protein
MHSPFIPNSPITQADLIGASLQWKRTDFGWCLYDGRRRMGAVVADDKHPGMWRVVLSGGRLSDMANLSWARNAVLDAAVRELQWEVRHRPARDPPITRDSGGVFPDKSSVVRSLEDPEGDSPPLAPDSPEPSDEETGGAS